MRITEVTRTYSRTIDTKMYGIDQSWIKLESTYTAEVDYGEDPMHVSAVLADAAQTDIASQIAGIVEKIEASKKAAAGGANFTPPAGSPPAPAVTTAQPATAAPANTYPGSGMAPGNETPNLPANGPQQNSYEPRKL